MSDENINRQLDHIMAELAALRKEGADMKVVQTKLTAFMRSELGFDSETAGNINRLGTETFQLVMQHNGILHGSSGKPGLIAWVGAMTSTWWIVISATIGLASYILGMTFPAN